MCDLSIRFNRNDVKGGTLSYINRDVNTNVMIRTCLTNTSKLLCISWILSWISEVFVDQISCPRLKKYSPSD